MIVMRGDVSSCCKMYLLCYSFLHMKTDIHPKYNEKVKATCVCGNSFDVGSTAEKIEVEICSVCHPLYTGKEKMLDTAGRVEKFRARREAAKPKKIASKTKPKGKK